TLSPPPAFAPAELQLGKPIRARRPPRRSSKSEDGPLRRTKAAVKVIGARAGSADFPCKEVELGSSPRCSTSLRSCGASAGRPARTKAARRSLGEGGRHATGRSAVVV